MRVSYVVWDCVGSSHFACYLPQAGRKIFTDAAFGFDLFECSSILHSDLQLLTFLLFPNIFAQREEPQSSFLAATAMTESPVERRLRYLRSGVNSNFTITCKGREWR